MLVNALVIRRVVKSSGGREAILANEQGALSTARREVSDLERTASKLACARSYSKECKASIPSRKCRAQSGEPLTGNSMRPSPVDGTSGRTAGEPGETLGSYCRARRKVSPVDTSRSSTASAPMAVTV